MMIPHDEAESGCVKTKLDGEHLALRVARLIRKSQPPGWMFIGYMLGGSVLVGVQLGKEHQIGPLAAVALACIGWATGSESEAAIWRRKLRKALRVSGDASEPPPRAPQEPGDKAREAK